jgi:hypothetical protein
MKVSVFLPQTSKHLGLRSAASPRQLALDTVHMGKPSFGTANPEHYHLLRNSSGSSWRVKALSNVTCPPIPIRIRQYRNSQTLRWQLPTRSSLLGSAGSELR